MINRRTPPARQNFQTDLISFLSAPQNTILSTRAHWAIQW